jgi:3-hydroxyisobutyrate dehydrogenase-like beta-hydroxyacid dehydrogenase
LGALEVMSKKTVFLGDVGAAAKMKLVVNMIMGSVLASFSEVRASWHTKYELNSVLSCSC